MVKDLRRNIQALTEAATVDQGGAPVYDLSEIFPEVAGVFSDLKMDDKRKEIRTSLILRRPANVPILYIENLGIVMADYFLLSIPLTVFCAVSRYSPPAEVLEIAQGIAEGVASWYAEHYPGTMRDQERAVLWARSKAGL